MNDATNAPAFNWREHLAVHPAADLFPLLSESELKELAEDIRKNGLQTRIVVALVPPAEVVGVQKKWFLLDGRNRADALALLGWIEPPKEPRCRPGYPPFPELPIITTKVNDRDAYEVIEANDDEEGHAELFRIALSLNVHRRHLTAEQKRELIATLLKANPAQSNRTVAKTINVDHKTVAARRSELESTGEIPQLEKTVGADGKSRKKPIPWQKRINSNLNYEASRRGTTVSALIEGREPTELETLRVHAKKLGYKVRKRGDSYCPIRADGTVHSSIEGTDSGSIAALRYALYNMEGKVASATYTPCGSMRTGDNSKVWLAANPGATMEDFEKALPPAPTGCDLYDESPEPAKQTALQPTDADASAEKRKPVSHPDSQPQAQRKQKQMFVNDWHRHIMGFTTKLDAELKAWVQEHAIMLANNKDARNCLHDALTLSADVLMHLAQKVDGRETAQIAGVA